MRTSHLSALVAAAALATAALGAGCSGSVHSTGSGGSGTSTSSGGTSMSTSSGSTGTSPSTSSGSTGTTSSGGQCGGTDTGRLARSTDKVDLLLVVDNSRSMADKQQILSLAIPDLIAGFVNPPCVDATGNPLPAAMQPSGPLLACPSGSQRLFPPVLDMHVGLLSSSLGSFGANGCPDMTPNACANGASSTSNNDHGHLVTRVDPCTAGLVPTYQSEGFLAWDPTQKLAPPGEPSVTGLVQSVHDLVIGDGQAGCGFESQNESWYRFLVDPTPYQSIALNGQTVQTSGTDAVLLQQRSAFLRPDSLLAIVVVTDETDTSIKENAFYPLFAQTISNGMPFHLPHPRQECSTKGPLDPCCASCSQAPPAGCPTDPTCAAAPLYIDTDENISLRAFGLISHKARYGVEFFYQPSRYVQALTSDTVTDGMGNTVPNPLFSGARDPSLVYYAAIVGVPWQLIARQKNGTPDLVNGVSALDPTAVGGFKSYGELSLKDPKGNTFWDDIAGDPEQYVPPRSPFMQESTVPRTGSDPITGTAISPATSPNGTNPINGHEWNIATPAGDIEYACIFPILTPIDCSLPGAICDCITGGGAASANNPLCDPNPNDNGNPTLQSRAKAYPGLKHLAIAKGVGEQGVVASICAKQLTDPTQADYGYRPAVTSILQKITPRLTTSISGQCLAKSLATGANGQVTCAVVEARNTGGAACDCSGKARSPVSAAGQCVEQTAKNDPAATTEGWNCFCEITETQGAAATACQNDPTATADGYCYVDATTTPPLGNAAFVAACPSTEKRLLRFVGAGQPAQGATVFFSCQ